MRITGQCFCVTGGARGLGKEVSLLLLSKGAEVIIVDSDADALSQMSATSGLTLLHCDLTKQVEIESTMREIFNGTRKVVGLINNAGVLHSEPLVKVDSGICIHSIESWRRTLDVNLTAPFVLSGYFVEHMIRNRLRGVIVNISSVSARGNAGQSAYAAAKAGLEALTKVWARELGSMGIRCVAVAPGFMDSDSTHSVMRSDQIDHIKDKVPLRRLGKPSECADIVCAVIQTDYVNGCIIPVDGGIQI